MVILIIAANLVAIPNNAVVRGKKKKENRRQTSAGCETPGTSNYIQTTVDERELIENGRKPTRAASEAIN